MSSSGTTRHAAGAASTPTTAEGKGKGGGKPKVVWLLHKKNPENKLPTIRIKAGESITIGRKFVYKGKDFDIKDIKISRNHLRLTARQDSLVGEMVGRNSARLVHKEGKETQLKQHDEFVWPMHGYVELSYFKRGVNTFTLIGSEVDGVRCNKPVASLGPAAPKAAATTPKTKPKPAAKTTPAPGPKPAAKSPGGDAATARAKRSRRQADNQGTAKPKSKSGKRRRGASAASDDIADSEDEALSPLPTARTLRRAGTSSSMHSGIRRNQSRAARPSSLHDAEDPIEDEDDDNDDDDDDDDDDGDDDEDDEDDEEDDEDDEDDDEDDDEESAQGRKRTQRTKKGKEDRKSKAETRTAVKEADGEGSAVEDDNMDEDEDEAGPLPPPPPPSGSDGKSVSGRRAEENGTPAAKHDPNPTDAMREQGAGGKAAAAVVKSEPKDDDVVPWSSLLAKACPGTEDASSGPNFADEMKKLYDYFSRRDKEQEAQINSIRTGEIIKKSNAGKERQEEDRPAAAGSRARLRRESKERAESAMSAIARVENSKPEPVNFMPTLLDHEGGADSISRRSPNRASVRGEGSPTSPTSPATRSNRKRELERERETERLPFSWDKARAESVPPAGSASDMMDFGFGEFGLRRQSSSASIMSSNKHQSAVVSPRALRRRRQSLEDEQASGLDSQAALDSDQLAAESDDAAAATEATGEQDHAGRKSSIKSPAVDTPESKLSEAEAVLDAGDAESHEDVEDSGGAAGGRNKPRVGHDFQVEVPTMLSNVRPINTIFNVPKSKGSISAWAAACQPGPSILEADADEKMDTTLDWTEEERLWFHKAMFEYLKDFTQIWRNVPIFKQHNKSPHDLISYYYLRYKDSEDYRRWKAFVSDSSGQGEGEGEGEEDGRPPLVAFATLKDMISAGALVPGPNKLVVPCANGGTESRATLRQDGLIDYKGMEFDSVSSFSVYVKRLDNPQLEHDNGWYSVHYGGRPLAEVRDEAINKRLAAAAHNRASAAQPPQPSGLLASHGSRESIGRATRRSSAVSTDSSALLKPAAVAPLPSGSLPQSFVSSTRTSAQAKPGPGASSVVTTKPRSQLHETGTPSRRVQGRVGVTAQAQRMPRFFDLNVETDSEDDDGGGGTTSSPTQPDGLDRIKDRKQITMRTLVDAGMLEPGKRVLRMTYKGHEFFADLDAKGVIRDSETGAEHMQPSGWSVERKRKINSNLRGDPGWYSVVYVPSARDRGGDRGSDYSGRGSENPKRRKKNDDADSGGAMQLDDGDAEGGGAEEEDDGDEDDEGEREEEEEASDEDSEDEPETLYEIRKRLFANLQEAREQEREKRFSVTEAVLDMREHCGGGGGGVARLPPRHAQLESHRFYLDEDRLGQELEHETDNGGSDSASNSGRKRRRSSATKKATSAAAAARQAGERFCACQSNARLDKERLASSDRWYLRCQKGTGACNGWVHPRCFGLTIRRADAEALTEFVCPLCSADGLELKAFDKNRKIKERRTRYAPGTLVMMRLDFPRNKPVGWFPGKIVEVDWANHADAPYRVAMAFNPSACAWVDLGPNDPTRMLAADWSRSSCFAAQDEQWRTAAARAPPP